MTQVGHDDRTRKILEKFLTRCSREELRRAFSEPWMNRVIPGLDALENCDQGTVAHLEGNVAIHTALVFENLFIVCQERLGRKPTFVEQLSVLFHDWRKPQTRYEPNPGEVSFPGHEERAARELVPIAKALGLSKYEVDQLVFIVGRHGDAHAYPSLSNAKQQELSSSTWKTSLALLQDADARSVLSPDGAQLPIYWNEIVGNS